MNFDLEGFGEVIRHLGSETFGRALLRLFDDLFAIRFYSVVALTSGHESRVVLAEGATAGDTEVALKRATELTTGRSRDSQLPTGRNAPGRAHCLNADEGGDTPLRKPGVDESGVGYQLLQFETLDGMVYCLHLSRAEDAAPFRTSDVVAARRVSRFAFPAIARHDALVCERIAPDSDEPERLPANLGLDLNALRDHVRQVFRETRHRLSEREAEVCAEIVLGLSTLAIGLKLDITYNTAATHRKRAYKKLGVCSRSQLFARYFESVRGSGVAPLRAAVAGVVNAA